MKKQGWFAEWFDTEYYHLLYRNRDDNEARRFIRLIVDILKFPENARIADIACGKGRHSRVLAGMGFRVAGFDLSANNIAYAKKHASGNEEFFIHDIREPYSESGFSGAFNLFTSFGYFETREEDLDALRNIYAMLVPGGFFVQDYINGPPVIEKLPGTFSEKCNGYEFDIKKSWKPPFVIKQITVRKPGSVSEFIEKVKLYDLKEMQTAHVQCGFELVNVYGDYELNPYEESGSARMILISRKPL